MRRAGRALLQLGRQGRCSAPVLLSTLFRFGNFMKKEGRSGTAGGGDSWRALLSRPVAADKLGRSDAGWWGWVEGERVGMMKGGAGSGSGAGALGAT